MIVLQKKERNTLDVLSQVLRFIGESGTDGIRIIPNYTSVTR